MRDLVPKLIKWSFTVFFFIAGFNMLYLTREGYGGAFIFAVFSFGIVYWQYSARDDVPKPVMLITAAVLGAAALAASYLSVFSFYPFTAGFFPSWVGWAYLLGIPIVGWSFKKFH